MRYPTYREFEQVWLRRLLLPLCILLYGTAFCVVLAGWISVLDPGTGYSRVATLALEGHVVAAILLISQVLIGDTVLERLNFTKQLSGKAERTLFAVCAGFLLSDLAFMLLAMIDAFDPLLTGCLLFAATAAAIHWRKDPLVAMTRRERKAGETDPLSSLTTVASGLVAIAAASYWLWPLLVQTALPNSDWDSALYHLPHAERYLAGQIWNPDSLFSANSFPGGVSLIYGSMIGAGFENAIIPYNFLFVLLNLLAVYALATRLGDARSGAWAVLICFGLHILWQQGVDPRIDGFLAFFVVTAMLALVIWLRDAEQSSPLFLLAISLGAALGTKYTALFIALATGGVVFLFAAWRRSRGEVQPSVRTLALCVTLVLIPNGAWYASNVVLHGDPLFPMLRGDYFEDTSRPGERVAMIGALDEFVATVAPDSLERRRARALAGRFESKAPANLFNVVEVFSQPDSYATKPNHFATPLILLFFALPFVLPRARERRTEWLVFWSLSGICLVGLASQTNLLRYTLPFLVLMGVAAALVIDRVRHPLWQAAWLVCGVAVLASNHPAEELKLARLQPDHFAETDADRLPWLTGVGYNFTRAMPIVVGRINQEIASGRMSPESLIMMAGEGKGRLLDCRFLPDLTWFMQRWSVELRRADADLDEVAQSLSRQGVTHILYNPAYFRWVLAHTDTPIDTLAYAMVQVDKFFDRHGDPVFELAGMRLVALKRIATATSD